jgi:hypothetical protein
LKRRISKNVPTVLCANDIYAENMMAIDIDAMRIPDPGGHPNATHGAERERERFRISDRRRRKAKSQKFVQKEGARDGTRTHVGMSKRLDLAIKGEEGTSHQAALVIGGIML